MWVCVCLGQKGLFFPFVRNSTVWSEPASCEALGQLSLKESKLRQTIWGSDHATIAPPPEQLVGQQQNLGGGGRSGERVKQPDLASSLPVARNAKCFPRKFLLQQEDEGRKPKEFLDTFQPVGVRTKKWEGKRADWLTASSVFEAATLPVASLLFRSYFQILKLDDIQCSSCKQLAAVLCVACQLLLSEDNCKQMDVKCSVTLLCVLMCVYVDHGVEGEMRGVFMIAEGKGGLRRPRL